MTLRKKIWKAKWKRINDPNRGIIMSTKEREAFYIVLFVFIDLFVMNTLIFQAKRLDFSEKIVVYNVIASEEQKPLERNFEPLVAQAEKEPETDIEKVVEIIHRLESSGGKNNYSKCEEQGLVNGSGYGIDGSGKYLCFKDRAEEIKTIASWFERKLKDYTLQEAICGYNLGFRSEHFQECLDQSEDYPYLRNFNKLSLN